MIDRACSVCELLVELVATLATNQYAIQLAAYGMLVLGKCTRLTMECWTIMMSMTK